MNISEWIFLISTVGSVVVLASWVVALVAAIIWCVKNSGNAAGSRASQ